MENSIYLGLSRQVSLWDNMQIVSNNVANMSTPGFRGQNLMFKEYVSDPRYTDDPLSFVYDQKQYQTTDPGPVSFTENPLDIYLEGPGYIGIIGPGGTVNYTRAGNFELSADGTLVTPVGFPVANSGGAPITIPEGTQEIAIDDRGFISTEDGQIGQIQIVEFENLQELEPLGNNLYSTEAATLPADNTTVKQGQLEGSNVKPIVEMTNMIETLRDFQSVQQLLQNENERLRTAIRQLSGQRS